LANGNAASLLQRSVAGPLPAFGYTVRSAAHSAARGTRGSISDRKISRCVAFGRAHSAFANVICWHRYAPAACLSIRPNAGESFI